MISAEPFQFADLSEDTSRSRQDQAQDYEHVHVRPAGETDNSFPALTFERGGSDCRPSAGKAAAITYTASELDAAVDQAKCATAAEVEASVKATMTAEANHRQSQALKAIGDQLAAGENAYNQQLAEAAVIARDLAIMLAKSVVPKALERQPFADIDDTIRQTLRRLINQPAIELRLAPDLVDATNEHLTALIVDTGYRGQLTTMADPSLEQGDAKLSWKGGVAERCMATIQAEVATLVDIWLLDAEHAEGDCPTPRLSTAATEPSALAQPAEQDDQPQSPERSEP